jgi:hypothetical protein
MFDLKMIKMQVENLKTEMNAYSSSTGNKINFNFVANNNINIIINDEKDEKPAEKVVTLTKNKQSNIKTITVSNNSNTNSNNNNIITNINKNLTQSEQETTPCFSKVKSHKEFKIPNRSRLANKENTKDNQDIGINTNTNTNTKIQSIKYKTVANLYRSPSPIVSKKTKHVVKNNSNNVLVPFTPVKNDNKVNNIINSKVKNVSSNKHVVNTPTINNISPFSNQHWLP